MDIGTGKSRLIVSGNTLSRIAATGGRNGENGNGVNILRCDGVIVVDNQFGGCAASAVRLQSAGDVIVARNLCRDSGGTGR